MVQTHIVINIQYVPTLSLLFSFTGCIFIAISRERGASQGSRSTQVRPWRILCERALAAGIDFLTYDPPQKRREFFAAACRNINFFTPRQGRGPLWTLADADRHNIYTREFKGVPNWHPLALKLIERPLFFESEDFKIECT